MTPDPEPGTKPDPKPQPPRVPFVVDISHYQPGITADVVRQWVAAGVTDVIVKMGGANGSTIYESDTHRAQVAAVRAAGIRAHRYWFNGWAASIETQIASIRKLLAVTPLVTGERFAWDIEAEGSMPRWSPTEVERAAGMLADLVPFALQSVYLSASVSRAAGWSSVVRLGLTLMVADYGENDGKPSSMPLVGHWPREQVWLWQYTDAGRLPGYPGSLDLSTGDLHNLWTVRDLQEALNAAYPDLPPLVVDGDPGSKTIARVVLFQTDHELKPDGIPGSKTLTALADVAG